MTRPFRFSDRENQAGTPPPGVLALDPGAVRRAGPGTSRLVWMAIGLLVLAGGSGLRAHNPDSSFATVRVADDNTLRVVVEMAAEAAMALYGVPIGTQGTPPNLEDLVPPLTRVAPDVYRFVVAGTELKPTDVRIEFREEDGVVFLLTFPLPVDWPDPPVLEFEARYLQHVGSEHQAAITLVDEQGGVGAGRILAAAKPGGRLPLRVD